MILDTTMSPQINEIAAALAKAQAAFPVLKKDSKAEIRTVKGAYSYQYADLGSVLDAIRGPLAANGLAYTQPIETTRHADNSEGTYLVTLLLHTSGQWLCSRFKIPMADLIGAQAVGSYIAYARRYSIAALTGLTIQDDDGHAAQRQAERPRAKPVHQEPGEPYADFTARTERLAPTPSPAREPGSDDAPAPAPAPLPTPTGARPAQDPRPRGKVRNGVWLAEASYKQGLYNEFLAIGVHLEFPDNMKEWTPAQVTQAVDCRREIMSR